MKELYQYTQRILEQNLSTTKNMLFLCYACVIHTQLNISFCPSSAKNISQKD